MKRRDFLRYSVAAAITLPGIVSLTGCGGGGGGGSTTTSSALSTDPSVASISTLQTSSSTQRAAVSLASTNLLTATESTSASVILTSVTSSPFVPTAPLFDKYQTSLPSTVPTWQAYLDHHDLAYTQAMEQITKLKASLRLHGYKQKASGQTSVGTQTAVSQQLTGTSTTLDSLLNNLNSLTLNELTIGLFTGAIEGVITIIKTSEGIVNYSYATVAFNTIIKILQWIQEKSLNNLSFSSNTNILLSLGKMGLAIVSALGVAELDKIKQATAQTSLASTTTSEQDQITAFLAATALQSQMILTLTSLVNYVMGDILTQIQTLSSNLANPDYVVTAEDQALIASFKPQSLALGAIGLALKAIINIYKVEIPATLEGDAQTFAFLFATPDNTGNLVSNVSFAQLLSDLAALTFPVPTTVDTTTTSSNPAYQFASDTATQAAIFTTHMADLAYLFTTKIEEDAYQFAMQGMEYGYLFASRGEEVGLMADRILWMAVQIGVMADRIGEMADRIVYTEQLIVYTEMLILDFGLLIYGGMKQITNLMLMGMAIVFDRQWYTPAANDQIVTVISDMTKQMLENMKEYENTVLTNQVTLRETTLKALNWIQGAY